MDTIKQVTERAKDVVKNMAGTEGQTTKKIERVTAAIPSATWLILAGGAVVGSLVLRLAGKKSASTFVGEWVPTILMLGLYNKLVKVMGSERREGIGTSPS